MADDLIEIAIDPYYPPPPGYEKYNKTTENKFELIYTRNPKRVRYYVIIESNALL